MVVGSAQFMYDSALTFIYLPDLSANGGDIQLNDDVALTSIELPLLQIIGSNLNVNNNPLLMQINLPMLSFNGGFVRVAGNNGITMVMLPLLTFIGGSVTGGEALVIGPNPVLSMFYVPSLTFIGPISVTVFGNAAQFLIPSVIGYYTNYCSLAEGTGPNPGADTPCSIAGTTVCNALSIET